MDIAERRRPQDGRIKITVGQKEMDLRVSIIPTNHGQSAVMRLLDKDNIKVGVKQLGLSDRDFKIFTGLIKRPNGILLVTGPTGSGKRLPSTPRLMLSIAQIEKSLPLRIRSNTISGGSISVKFATTLVSISRVLSEPCSAKLRM